MADKYGYSRIAVRQEDFERLNKFRQRLTASDVGSYHTTASHSDAIKYLLDLYDNFVAETDASTHDTVYTITVNGVEHDKLYASRVMAEAKADAIKSAMPKAEVAINELSLKQLDEELPVE